MREETSMYLGTCLILARHSKTLHSVVQICPDRCVGSYTVKVIEVLQIQVHWQKLTQMIGPLNLYYIRISIYTTLNYTS